MSPLPAPRRRTSCGATAEVGGRSWRDVDFCALDFETTGLDLRRDAILSYGAVTVRGGRIRGDSATYSLARPGRDASPGATSVHALRLVDTLAAPSPEETAEALRRVLAGKILVAHAAWIETSFLRRYLGLVGARPGPMVIDTAALARAAGLVGRDRRSEPSLEWLATELGLPVHTPHHALGDAMTTATVFLALVASLSPGGGPTAGDLVRISRENTGH